MQLDYPKFVFFPLSQRPPTWTRDITGLFTRAREKIDTKGGLQKKSDDVLAILRPGLESLKFLVEKRKKTADRLQRPVLFEEMGRPGHKYEIDAYQEENRIVLEIEAGRATKGNAIYRDLIHMSLMFDADLAVIGMPVAYRHKGHEETIVEVPSYGYGKRLLEAIYASRRLQLPFKGILLIGY